MLGEEKFKGVEIYDVIQDNNEIYYFATNSGIYRYDYYNYQKIECDKAKSSSVFNFVSDKSGVIYCNNLNNQVFRIKDKECSLFYELQEAETSSDISLAIGNDDNLIIGAKKIIVLDKKGKALLIFPVRYYLSAPYITLKNTVQFHFSNGDTLIEYDNGKFLKHHLVFEPAEASTINSLKIFLLSGSTFAIDLKTKKTYSYDAQNFKLKLIPGSSIFSRSESLRLYQTGKELWVAGTLRGTVMLNNKVDPDNFELFYKDYLISDIYEDKEGNVLLSTFDKGVLVIPDLNIPDVINSFHDDPVTTLFVNKNTELVLGTAQGTLIKYANNSFTPINQAGKRTIEGIYSATESDFVLFDDGQIRAYNKTSGKISNITQASLKDVAFVSPDRSYLGTNTGVLKCISGAKGFKIEKISGLEHRIYSLEYDPFNKKLFAASSKGLLIMDSLGGISNITYNKMDIYPLDQCFYNGNLYVSTQKNGVLIFNGKQITDSISPHISKTNEALDKILIRKNSIIGSSPNGLFEFDLNGNLIKPLHTVFGFPNHSILDFAFQDNFLWVIHSGGVQKIDLSYSQPAKVNPTLTLKTIYLNDKEIDHTSYSSFKSDERKVEFVLALNTLRNHKNIHYYYKLLGYDNTWNTNDFNENKITYNALAAGSYTFVAKAGENEVAEQIVNYCFTISAPFYYRWWFITSAIILFLLIVLWVYKLQLNIQQKKSKQINELNASKLTAIQSQMNPHFIFNSLNSIQDLVLKGDVENSYSYITTFSNLVRRTLNYSDKDFIDFDQEIKLLEIYLSLEKLRFKKDLQYTLETKGIENVMLPPLMIQPFIENALIHGLLHKEGERKLRITFKLNETLECIIEDNGIGREKAKAIKQRQKVEHESFSGKAIHNRFEILSNVFKGKYGYTYEDLYENNESIGTRVTLKLPIKHKF
ncbi:MAG: histidine kinase [Bacteroidia bacterium]